MHRLHRKTGGEVPYDPHIARHMWIGPAMCFLFSWWQVFNLYYVLYMNPILPMDGEDELGSLSDGGVWLPFLYGLTAWVTLQTVCLVQAVRKKPVSPPPIETLTINGLRYASILERDRASLDKVMAYCDDCKRHKPAYCHHCRWCKACVLKFDHHCMAINNCVGMHNYKYFFLLLLHSSGAILAVTYALIASSHAGTILSMCAKQVLSSAFSMNAPDSWSDMAARATRIPSGTEAALLFMAVATALSTSMGLPCFVLFHARLLAMQQTTLDFIIETNQTKSGVKACLCPSGKNKLSVFHRITLIMGSSVLLWLFPVLTSKDRSWQMEDAMVPFEIEPLTA